MSAQQATDDFPDLQANISRVVRGLMGLAGMSHQSELAGLLGVSRSGVTDKLSGVRKWKVEDLHKMARHFGVSVSVFYEPSDTVLIRLSRSGYEPTKALKLIRGKVPEQAERGAHQPGLLVGIDT